MAIASKHNSVVVRSIGQNAGGTTMALNLEFETRTASAVSVNVSFHAARTDGFTSTGTYYCDLWLGSQKVTKVYNGSVGGSYVELGRHTFTASATGAAGTTPEGKGLLRTGSGQSNYVNDIGIPQSVMSKDVTSYTIHSNEGRTFSYAAMYTACSAPTTLSCTITPLTTTTATFKGTWSGAKAGTGNSITGYYLQYQRYTPSTNSWGAWTNWTLRATTATSGTWTTTIGTAGYGGAFRFRVQTRGSAGSSYYSGYSTQSNYDTYPAISTQPTSITASLTETSATTASVTINWSGASAGYANTISGYTIYYQQYRASTDTYGAITALVTVSTTSTSGSRTQSIGINTTGGGYRFSVRTNCSAGSAWYSSYTRQSSWAYWASICAPPTTASLSITPTNTTTGVNYVLSGSGAVAGYQNPIKGYEIQYRSRTSDGSYGSWSAWSGITTTSSSYSDIRSGSIAQGSYIQYQIRTLGSGSNYHHSAWKVSNEYANPVTVVAPSLVDLEIDIDGFTARAILRRSVSWVGASGTSGNSLTGFNIQSRYWDKEANTYTAWQTINYTFSATSSGNDVIIDSEGFETDLDSVQVRMQAKGSAGVYRYSDWVESNLEEIPRPPNPPQFLSLPLAEDVIVGSVVSFSWSVPTDVNDNLISYAFKMYYNEGSIHAFNTYNNSISVQIPDTDKIVFGIEAVDSSGLQSSSTFSSEYTVISNIPPVISGEDSDLGLQIEPFMVHYEVEDDPEDLITVTEYLNDQPLKPPYSANPPISADLVVDESDYISILNGVNRVSIVAEDDKGLSDTRTYTFTKSVTEIDVSLSTPLNADDRITRGIMEIVREIPEGAIFIVEVCNNGYDEEPKWEEITNAVLNGTKFFFSNKVKTAVNWGFNFRVRVDRNDTVGNCNIVSIGGNYE